MEWGGEVGEVREEEWVRRFWKITRLIVSSIHIAFNNRMKSAANVGVWLHRLDVLLNDDINVGYARTFPVCSTIA